MVSKLDSDLKGLLKLPPEEILDKWKSMLDTHLYVPEGYEGKREGLTNEQISDIFFHIGKVIFRQEVVRKNPLIVLEFIKEFGEFDSGERYQSFANSPLCKDAYSLVCLKEIKSGRLLPNADPYFETDPEDPIRMMLNYGIRRNLFSRNTLESALNSQKKGSLAFLRQNAHAMYLFDKEHTSFANNLLLNDYGFHVFLGRMRTKDGDYIIRLDSIGTPFVLGESAKDAEPHLWEAVRKNRKVLLSKSPGGSFIPFKSEQMSELYTEYYSDKQNKYGFTIPRIEFDDPFLYQPK